MPTQAPDGDIYLSPVYLAGSTFTGDPALQPLLDQAFHLHLDELSNVYVTSPEQHVRLGYLPEGEDSTLWKIAVHSDPFAPPAGSPPSRTPRPRNSSPPSPPPSPTTTPRATTPTSTAAPAGTKASSRSSMPAGAQGKGHTSASLSRPTAWRK